MSQHITKRFVAYFLRLNGLHSNAPEGEIRTLLARARWPTADIERALAVCRTGEEGEPLRAFRPDMSWSSTELSQFLGVSVEPRPQRKRASVQASTEVKSGGTAMRFLLACALALLIAALLFACLVYLS